MCDQVNAPAEHKIASTPVTLPRNVRVFFNGFWEDLQTGHAAACTAIGSPQTMQGTLPSMPSPVHVVFHRIHSWNCRAGCDLNHT
jgi:hypothetical protein